MLKIEQTPAFGHVLGAFDEQHLFALVGLFHFYFDGFVLIDLHATTDICGLDRQLAMAAIDQDCELHPSRTSMIEQSIQRSADRSTCVKNVVYQNHVTTNYIAAD